ncbi:hypothetical protein K040078D81_16200 [Blautia hominis]|uniref:Uncharacterized protein n=1 Tax=Blautia hominis TaxID=2025493 RepID=A0ABQ0B7S9_9FIRM
MRKSQMAASSRKSGSPHSLFRFILLSPDEIHSVYHMPYSVQCFIGADRTEMVLATGFGWFVEL